MNTTTVQTEGYAISRVLDEVVVLVWKKPPVDAGVQALRTAFQAMKAQRGARKFALFVVVEADAGYSLPKTPRELLRKLLADYHQSIATSVVILTAAGAAASIGITIVRTVANTFNLINKSKFPTLVETNIDVGAHLVTRALPHLDPARLRVAIEQVRGS